MCEGGGGGEDVGWDTVTLFIYPFLARVHELNIPLQQEKNWYFECLSPPKNIK